MITPHADFTVDKPFYGTHRSKCGLRDFASSTASGANPDSYPMVTRGSFSGDKAA